MELYPLRFEPIFQTYLWGGRCLRTELNKPIGDDPTYAESWEIVDHGDHQSIVSSGSLAGSSLGELVRSHGIELLGKSCFELINDPSRPDNLVGRFPLLFKFLDANQNLSVQVHPDDAMGAQLEPPDLGKTEAWFVLNALPGSKIYAGLKQDVSRADLQTAIENNTAESVLHSFEPKTGDCVFIPAGTVHALGQGLLIAEIQQCSNTTFRLYDWGRVDKDGRPRELHIVQGIQATNFDLGPVNAHSTQADDDLLVDCKQFKMRKLRLPNSGQLETTGSFKIMAVIEGSVSLTGDPSGKPLLRGDTCLIPAGLSSIELKADDEPEILWISPD